MQKLNGETLDIINTNIDKLKEIFPDVFSEGKIDFEALKSNLGEFIDKENERYSFSWNGKEKAKKIALTTSTGTLRPCKDESKNWETTENLYIEGDNLEVLKLLQKSYFEKVKMIYIDPPYNTGNKEFIYDDDFSDNIKNYLQKTGQIDSEGNKINTSLESNGRFHSDWLNMMYPRLKLARNLLKDDGVMFISIDDKEASNLKKMCDEIFGEENFLINAIWISGRTSSAHFTNAHEYILCYAKNIKKLDLFKYKGEKSVITDRTIKKPGPKNPYSIIKFPRGIDFESEDKVFPNKIGENEPIEIIDGLFECKDGKLFNDVTIKAAWTMKDMILNWLAGKEVFDQKGQKVLRFFFKNNGVLQYEKEKGTVHPNSIIKDITTKNGSIAISNLIGKDVFDFPKAIDLINYFMFPITNKNDIILDFFSGSATTAHAVMDLNTQDEGNRKFIMVQLPELTDEKSEAYKSGYKNICEIGKARIDKAGDKIKKDFQEENNKIKLGEEQKEFKTDIGFKVFKLDSSNIKAWDSEYAKDNIQQSLIDSISNVKEDRTELDLLFELLLKQGLDLTTPITEIKTNDKIIYNIGAGALYVSLSDNITVDVAEKIIEENEIYNSPRVTVIFKDNGFKNDVDKTNVIQTLKVAGISDIKSI